MVDEKWFTRNKARLSGPTDAERFSTLDVRQNQEPRVRREYSITSDVLSFRRCSRQYGYFSVLGFVPAQITQIYYGTIIHEVLDRAHRQFKGKLEGFSKGRPTEEDIRTHFRTVAEAMRAKRIHPYGKKGEEVALGHLIRFNEDPRLGPALYPRVKDTEHKLKVDRRNFILTGVVDVLVGPDGKGGDDGTEIWDYKGAKRSGENSPELKNYEFQMQVYAHLFKQKNGFYPTRSVLCFIEEATPERMFYEVPFDERSVKRAMSEFGKTVNEIETRIDSGDWSPPKDPPTRQTCAACDLRWDCPTPPERFAPSYP